MANIHLLLFLDWLIKKILEKGYFIWLSLWILIDFSVHPGESCLFYHQQPLFTALLVLSCSRFLLESCLYPLSCVEHKDTAAHTLSMSCYLCTVSAIRRSNVRCRSGPCHSTPGFLHVFDMSFFMEGLKCNEMLLHGMLCFILLVRKDAEASPLRA